VSLNKRFSHGLQAQVSYTFSRNLTTDPLTSVGGNGGCSNGDQNNPKQRGPDFFVHEHRLIPNYTHQFPSPKNLSSARGRILGGWGVAGVTTFQSGHKLLVIFSPNGQNVFGQTADRASLSGACAKGRYLTPGSVTSISALISTQGALPSRLASEQTTPTPWDSATPAREFTTDPDKTISICRLQKSSRSAGRAKIRRLNSARSSLTLSTTPNSVIRTWTSRHPHSGRCSARVSQRALSSLH